MKHSVAWILSVMLSSLLLVPAVSQSSQTRIEGVVTRLGSDDPARGVSVAVGSSVAFSDAAGRFSIDGLTPGSYDIVVGPIPVRSRSSVRRRAVVRRR